MTNYKALKGVKYQSNVAFSDFFRDITRSAKAPGKRKSKNGKIYYEHRQNRSDMPGTRV